MTSDGVIPTEEFTVIDGPDELGFYTAYNQHGLYAHVNEDGVPIYEVRFEDIGMFQEGFAVAQKDHCGYHIKPDGSPAYDFSFKDGVVMPFENGTAEVFAVEGNLFLRKMPDGTIVKI